MTRYAWVDDQKAAGFPVTAACEASADGQRHAGRRGHPGTSRRARPDNLGLTRVGAVGGRRHRQHHLPRTRCRRRAGGRRPAGSHRRQHRGSRLAIALVWPARSCSSLWGRGPECRPGRRLSHRRRAALVRASRSDVHLREASISVAPGCRGQSRGPVSPPAAPPAPEPTRRPTSQGFGPPPGRRYQPAAPCSNRWSTPMAVTIEWFTTNVRAGPRATTWMRLATPTPVWRCRASPTPPR